MPPVRVENFSHLAGEGQKSADFGIDMSSAADARWAERGNSCPAITEQILIEDEFGTIKNQPTEYGKWLLEQNSEALNEKPSDAPAALTEKQQQIADQALEALDDLMAKKHAGNFDITSELKQLQELFGGSKSSLNFRLPREFFAPITDYLKQQLNEKYKGVIGIGTSDVTGQIYLGFNRGTLSNPDYLPQYHLGGRADCSQFNGAIF